VNQCPRCNAKASDAARWCGRCGLRLSHGVDLLAVAAIVAAGLLLVSVLAFSVSS